MIITKELVKKMKELADIYLAKFIAERGYDAEDVLKKRALTHLTNDTYYLTYNHELICEFVLL